MKSHEQTRVRHRTDATQDKINTILGLKQAGFSLREIGAKLGITHAGVDYFFRLGTAGKHVCKKCGHELNKI